MWESLLRSATTLMCSKNGWRKNWNIKASSISFFLIGSFSLDQRQTSNQPFSIQSLFYIFIRVTNPCLYLFRWWLISYWLNSIVKITNQIIAWRSCSAWILIKNLRSAWLFHDRFSRTIWIKANIQQTKIFFIQNVTKTL